MPVLLAGKEFGKACLFDDGVGSKTLVVIKFHLALENLALRQQLAVLERSGKRPKLRPRDRMFWVLLSAIWHDWRSALVIVKPSKPVCLLLDIHSASFRERGPTRQDGRIPTIADWGVYSIHARAA